MSESVLIVAAHPDDEVLGAGATIHKLATCGVNVYVAIASLECPTRESGLDSKCRESHRTLGVKRCFAGSFECMAFDKADHYEMVGFIEDAIRAAKPNTVIMHHPADIHPDHKALALCTLEAVRLPQRQTESLPRIRRVLCMEVPSSTDWSGNISANQFQPNAYVEVRRDDLEAKIRALRVYDEVVRETPHPRSESAIIALSEARGAIFGVPMAEAFQQVFGEAL